MRRTIALVDDDQNILTSVSIALETEGYRVKTYKDGEEALRGIGQHSVDLAILDIKMPRMDGLRQTSHLPIIFLTSKDDEIDELLGFRMGADDYIKKPFSQRLLIERIRALIRRIEVTADGPSHRKEEQLIRGDLVLDPERHFCTWQGKPVQ